MMVAVLASEPSTPPAARRPPALRLVLKSADHQHQLHARPVEQRLDLTGPGQAPFDAEIADDRNASSSARDWAELSPSSTAVRMLRTSKLMA